MHALPSGKVSYRQDLIDTKSGDLQRDSGPNHTKLHFCHETNVLKILYLACYKDIDAII